MQKTLLLILLAFISPTLFAQLNPNGAKYAGNDGIGVNRQFNDMGGNPIPINDHSSIGGSPLLNADFGQGIVRLKNGNYFSDTALGYSLYENKLFVRRQDGMYPVNDDVVSFSIEYPANGSSKKIYSFENGFPAIDRNDGGTFYQILYHGKDYTLLKWIHEKVQMPYNYGEGSKRQYVMDHGYFAYSLTENKMVFLGNKVTIKNLKKKLPQYDSKIAIYVVDHKFKGKEEGDIIKLFTFLN